MALWEFIMHTYHHGMHSLTPLVLHHHSIYLWAVPPPLYPVRYICAVPPCAMHSLTPLYFTIMPFIVSNVSPLTAARLQATTSATQTASPPSTEPPPQAPSVHCHWTVSIDPTLRNHDNRACMSLVYSCLNELWTLYVLVQRFEGVSQCNFLCLYKLASLYMYMYVLML